MIRSLVWIALAVPLSKKRQTTWVVWTALFLSPRKKQTTWVVWIALAVPLSQETQTTWVVWIYSAVRLSQERQTNPIYPGVGEKVVHIKEQKDK